MIKAQRGFTLVELLVILSIIILLLAILMSGVMAAREASRRVKCQNNLRQIGIASQNFVSSHGALPGNGWGFKWRADPRRGIGPGQPGGWIFQISKFCEFSAPESAEELHVSPFPLMRCPSRGGGELLPASEDAAPVNVSFANLVPKTDYAANEGDFPTRTDGGPATLEDGDNPNFPWTPTEKATGVIFLRSEVRYAMIHDGLSATYLAGEKSVDASSYHNASDPGYDQSLFSGVDWDLNRWTFNQVLRDSEQANVQSFGSAHPSGCSMVLCDGSIRLVGYNVDFRVHRSMGNRSDGQ